MEGVQRGLQRGTEGCGAVELHREMWSGGEGHIGDGDSCYTHWLIVSQLKRSIIFCPRGWLPSVIPTNHRFSG